MSSWSEWSEPECNVSCGKGSLVSRAFCEKNGIDCIGPGPFCCANTRESCECKVFIENGIMEVKRFTMPCTRSISCPIVSRRRGFLPENQIKESESYDIDEYEEFNREKINGNLYDDADDYEIMNKNDNEEFEKKKRTVDDDDFDDNDKDYDSDDTKNTSDNIEDNEEEENEKNNNDLTMPAVTTDDYETVYEDKSSGSLPRSRILFPIFANFVIFISYFG
ncbi:pheromone-processing carboxypeptidase KEX1-like [Leptopilina heterotoma]|uniref:pheromone-processing carboxypeptidase KEX1-like n=1 Tax=Leptopilina heterotoma TaxID=63436 RepID=UPI001CA909B1|nr:pheromone-processing carboxypeptidase KEX1-like [Leptopilina heterotoma]